ncbi:ABC transporter permease [Vulcaniibacterium thermophilum]|uniref:Transport permease protein n=2 Tax=Gammaproteobacteria TaxID=1236 RepID=A0A919DGW0_9GAMM|nr:ABC transporter permease [Vulcaniibacterium thermophilum]GHE41217.1 transport permease protein [Vulcaniibacterium thermophilum]
MSTATMSFEAGLPCLLASLRRNRDLIRQLVRQEIVGRYRGSFMGVAWSLLTPVLMLLIYTFVFSVVFGARWGGLPQGGKAAFAVVLFAGMAVFNVFSEVVVRAPNLVVANANYVKRVVFPLEVLPIVQMGNALFHFAVNMAAWLVAAWVVLGTVPWTAWLLPVVLGPLILGTLGIAWLLASLGVFVRDMAQTVGLLVTALLFLTPIFYPLEAIPEDFRPWLALNPLAHVVEQARALLIGGTVPALRELALSWGLGVLVMWLGFAWFQKTRKGFADVL